LKYIKWDDVSYHGNIFGCLKSYFDENALSKTKQLKKCQDFKVMEDIYKGIKSDIDKCILGLNLSVNVKESANVVTMAENLKLELKKIQNVLEEADELRELIKEKKRLIVKDTEPKKHRIKEEE